MSLCLHKPANLALIATSISALLMIPNPGLANTSASHPPMPITFESNEGQAAPNVKFISRGASGVLYLSPSEITLRAPGRGSQLRLTLRGATNTGNIVGSGESSGTVNYLHGNVPSAWLTNIPSFSKVTYKSVYPSIDLIVYGNNREFESDFVLAQNADPSTIALQIDGKLDIRNDGSLSVQSDGGKFQLHRPFVYQLTASGDKSAVDCHYTISAGNQVGFAIGQYDHSKSLIIDPVLSYGTYLGGTKDDSIFGVTEDTQGNLYVTGSTTSLDFPTLHPVQAKEGGDSDCFVAKFDPTGQHLIYSTYLGGSNFDRCTGLAVNSAGEVFLGGDTYSNNFPTRNAIQPAFKGTGANAVDGFVVHLDCTGSRLIFSTYLGGGGEFQTGIAIDHLSNVYVTGVTNSPKYPVTSGAYQATCGGPCLDNAFVSKLDAYGCRLVYSTYLGGSTNYDSANGIAVDSTGSAYVVGEAHSSDFPTTAKAYQTKLAGPSNSFVTKFSPDGTSLVYSTLVGGANFDSGRSIAVDLFGNAYVAGATNSLNFPTINAFQSQYVGTGSPNIFVFKLNPAGTALGYSTYIGGSQYNYPFHIALDSVGSASVVGETTSINFPVKSPIQAAFGGGNLDAVVMNFSTTGALNFSTYLGGSNDEYGYAIYTDQAGYIWVGGQTYSANFPVTKGFQGKLSGTSDAFLVKISQ